MLRTRHGQCPLHVPSLSWLVCFVEITWKCSLENGNIHTHPPGATSHPDPNCYHFGIFSSFGVTILFKKIVCIAVYLINNFVIVSGNSEGTLVIYMHVSILPQTPLPSRLPHNLQQSSLCYTEGLCWLCILNIAVCTCPSQIS